MLRLIGVLFLLAAGAAVFHDLQQDGPFVFSALGDLWFTYHKESLIGLQSGLENRISLDAFATIEPVLYQPAAPLLGAIGLAFFVLGSLLRVRAASRRAARI